MRRLTFAAISILLAATLGQAWAQTASSQYTTHHRYNDKGQLMGSIGSDPDGAGPLKYPATRNTYDSLGRLTKVESGELATWFGPGVLPADWGTDFTITSVSTTDYDGWGRPVTATGWDGGTRVSVAQTSYDAFGRTDCVAVRMNPAAYNPSLGACSLGAAGTAGPDRITKTEYDEFSRVKTVKRALGTSLEQAYQTYTYFDHHQPQTVTDAKGNRTTYHYDGFHRLEKQEFPSKTTANASNALDFESYTYDKNGNRKSLRKRDGQIISYDYDGLNRLTHKDLPGSSADVFYAYDLRGLELKARFVSLNGEGVTNTYDGFGRLSTAHSSHTNTTLSYLYDKNGNRERVTHPDGKYFQYFYDGANRLVQIQEYSAQIFQAQYRSNGLPGALTHANRLSVTLDYDALQRLDDFDLSVFNNASHNLSEDYGFNPASQLVSRALSNPDYMQSGASVAPASYTPNGLNQYQIVDGVTFNYDDNGNLISDGPRAYAYDAENRLTSFIEGGQTTTLKYDPHGRLYEIAGGATTRFAYDGDAMVLELDGDNEIQRRYVHGGAVDSPLVWYEGEDIGASHRRHLVADRLGSIIAVSLPNQSGVTKNTYDEYGNRGAGNLGRFQYTGQTWLPELDLYYYKARIYNPRLGRFMQTDPIGYDDQMNLYAYVANDPLNKTDPSGMVVGKAAQWVLKEQATRLSRLSVQQAEKAAARAVAAARKQAVQQAWKEEQRLAKLGKPTTRLWSGPELDELIEKGRVKGYDGHHINDVEHHPQLAGDPDNIRFLTKPDHDTTHAATGGTRGSTTGPLVDRTLGGELPRIGSYRPSAASYMNSLGTSLTNLGVTGLTAAATVMGWADWVDPLTYIFYAPPAE